MKLPLFLLLLIQSCSFTPNVLEDKDEHNASARYFDYVDKKMSKIDQSKKVLECIRDERQRIEPNIPQNRKINVQYVIEMSGYIENDGIRVIAEFPITMNFETCLKKILSSMIFEIPYDLKPFQGNFELDINPSQEKL